MAVVGTAGHVDHGKSTLVTALTGRDPDRWEEEKRRGLTIDLGFAWTELPGGIEVSFVDVPGHERFMKNMLAGIEAVDVALLVVAADEGWMPQSEEHLAVLDLLGVENGVVALTKIDRVDGEFLDLVRDEVRDRLSGSSLVEAPIVSVSAQTGEGLEELRLRLAEAVAAVPPPPEGRPRLWVDRVFSIAGAGTVVTGTLLGGSLETGMELAVWPERARARVRGLQIHEREAIRVVPRSRVAVNLAGVDRRDLRRGSMLGSPEGWRTTRRLLASFRTAPYVTEVTDRGAHHFHTGSSGWPARLHVLHHENGEGHAIVTLDADLCLTAGDRFILRETGRRAVVAGGRILDPSPGPGRPAPGRAAELAAVIDGSPGERATVLLAGREKARLSDLEADSGGGSPSRAWVVGRTAFTPELANRLAHQAVETVTRFQAENPLRPGMPAAELAPALEIEPEVLAALATETPELAMVGGIVSVGAGPGIDPTSDIRWPAARDLLESSWPAVPTPAEMGLDDELVHALARVGACVRISPSLVYLPHQVERITAVLSGLGTGFTVSEFREAAGMSRKYAVPVLEWADRAGITVRSGDVRRVRDRRADG
ncbi:MAG: selenocysteine-specific translation elongation factor [Acidimicrobiia bacterium]|jgi:selenocysteine-specific elongation factor